jgi:hypothetical protein
LTAAVLHFLDEEKSMFLMELGVRCKCVVYLTLMRKLMVVKQYGQTAEDLDSQNGSGFCKLRDYDDY